MKTNSDATDVVLSYIKALDKEEYDAAGKYLNNSVRIKGPAGETFSKSSEFIKMLRQYHGKYELKKTFADGDDVCLFYDLVTPSAKVFMCSWYHVLDGKITSIQTVFDPQAFSNQE
ncbi:MAG: nuclear transport factor 2 family protein [Candidatus Thermoplasmatota archaeon]|nr:nuclear transport factor 2 family protein [Candidatus Thermoplasmatota archaeon]MCL6091311.1 nuclear transport factor 2 family protein [Candidatus Thermoplasmatota archaeon]